MSAHLHPVATKAENAQAAGRPAGAELEARRFLRGLREEIRMHPGVNHMFLNRLATMPFTREDYKTFGLQHYPLINCFTHYLENVLIRAPNSEAKCWIAKVLVDEYGEGSDGHYYSTLYLDFLRAAGAKDEELDRTVLNPYTVEFIRTHVEITTQRPFLVALGAIGPGHEWAIPIMFSAIVPGLRRAGFGEQEIRYFWLHMDQDEDHGSWLEEALVNFATTTEARAQIREGAFLSLDAREKFWTGAQREVVRWRQPLSAKTFVRRLRAAANQRLRDASAVAPKLIASGVDGLRRRWVPTYLDDVLPHPDRAAHK